MAAGTENLRSIGLFRSMLRIRLIEEEIARVYTEGEMRCPVHLSIGQEATAVGACAPLLRDDLVVSTHRCHGHYLAKGGDLTAMIAELHGRASGCCGGRGGSMHLFDDAAGVLASVPIVGSNLPLAVGAALAISQRAESKVVVAFSGDGAVEEGAMHECMNFASLHALPVIFFVENNLYSVYTRIDERQPARDLSKLGLAHDMLSVHIDGNDVVEVARTMRQCVDRARAGGGPSLIVADTYRTLEHCGPNVDDDLGYRPPLEVSSWTARCPLGVLRDRLSMDELLSPEAEETMRAEIALEIEVAFRAARSGPSPSPTTLGDHVFAASVASLEARP